ncbi:ATP-grasp domain-containing protein [Kitasatospora herbaricolor]|uniref:ATP-grasp domain-containing protein n=1 Tax=Kitasatospora herbaricolor TaxID=68217 RepID=UPI001748A179|nr:ATP-grasp domain-containing protein [Kitasatospora herbaricolor]MDQ0310097.1 biotin carboxylase [Kitasatospora herbaricolor]GGV17763.1 ATP-grasp domain-containing protein [Kitasatospora herbaricolor]
MTTAVVDAYGIARFLPAALRRYGVEYLHVRSQEPDIHLAYRPEDFTVDLQHEGDLAATAARLREHGVDFVVAGAESGVLLADALSAELGTPGNGMTRPASRRDKFAMAAAVKEAGLAAAESLLSASAEETVAWAERLGEWPVVLKPVASAGTDHVFFCDSPQEIRTAHATVLAAVDRYGRRNTQVLAQQFLDGDEYFVNTVSRDGVHHIVEVWRYHDLPKGGGRSIPPAFEHPVPPEDPAARQLGDYVPKVLDALEIRNGSAHTEVMLTARGPVLVECGARLGGAHLPDVVNRAIGTDQVDLLALAIARPERITGRTLPPYRLLTHLRYLNLMSPRDGVVPSEEAWAEVRALPSFLDMVLTIPPGKPVARTVDLATVPGYLYLSSDDAGQVEADYRRLRQLEADGLYDA